jgi:hypothetical protein
MYSRRATANRTDRGCGLGLMGEIFVEEGVSVEEQSPILSLCVFLLVDHKTHQKARDR